MSIKDLLVKKLKKYNKKISVSKKKKIKDEAYEEVGRELRRHNKKKRKKGYNPRIAYHVKIKKKEKSINRQEEIVDDLIDFFK